ncbi:hypothetical protein NGB36_17210 [Streptomyces sp. RB6PN25]|uniref:Bulb-type lectin domain-containing protein n=1 Tax=Streptomyces humicola TaxID=2953240 RepID=A0ABT1Q0L2_9ACTN|nr:hypothetical protein [Streptomyces humicola]MCQ4082297.1 hypothetical protein [Streptomyces humicola]
MAQRALVHGSIAVAAAFTLVSGLASLAAPAAHADSPSESVIPAALRDTPPADNVVFAGPGGFLHKQEGQTGYEWTTYAGSVNTPVNENLGVGVGKSGAGADVVATAVSDGIQLQDMDTGTTTLFTIPAGQTYLGTFGSRVVTTAPDTGDTGVSVHVLSQSNGQETDTTVTGMSGDTNVTVTALAGDANSVVLRQDGSSGSELGLLDLATARADIAFIIPSGHKVQALLSDTYVAMWDESSTQPVLNVLKRTEIYAPITQVPVPAPPLPSGYTATPRSFAIVGDSLLATFEVSHTGAIVTDDTVGYPLYSMPLSGSSLTPVLDHANMDEVDSGPGGAVVLGGTSVTDWAVRRVTADTDSTLAFNSVEPEPVIPSPIDGLSLAGGTLFTDERNSSPTVDGFTRSITLGGTAPSYGDHTAFGNVAVSSDCDAAATCVPPIGTGDGRISQLWKNGNGTGDLVTVQNGSADDVIEPGATGGTLIDSNGRYVVYDGGSTNKQYIGDTESANAGHVLFTRPITAAALSGSTLWVADPTEGSISQIGLATQKTVQTVATGAPCTPSELQASASRWVYWSCGNGGPSGVWDLTNGKDIPVPSAGLAQLGDGFLVEHDRAAGKLELTDFHTGTAVTSDLTALPAGPLTDDRRVTWAVDKYDGGIAYLDAQENIDVVDPHVPASAPAPAGGDSILTGQLLTPGRSVSSGSVTLTMQSDGNLVAYLKTGGSGAGAPLWASGTSGHPGAYAVMQTDGNLVVYAQGGGAGKGGALWASGTSGHPGAYATVQDDGNVVVYQGSQALWATGTWARQQTIGSGTVIKAGWWTQGTLTRLVMQPDGNLVMYRKRDGAAIWASGTSHHPGAYAEMQTDGNLVVYAAGGGPGKGGALWATGTSGHSGAYALMQDDGNFVVYRGGGGPGTGGALWASGTWQTAR